MSVGLSGVTKRFEEHAAVDGVTADIAAGEFFVVLGPSGCGKSTLLRLIAGLERLDEGRICLEEVVVSSVDTHVPPEARRVGVVFQSYALWPHMDVRDNVAFPIESAGGSRRDARRAADVHLGTVALKGFAGRRPAELSGGQRQRVALARCLAGGARTILMDEPLANLDPHLRAAMETEIATFHQRTGATTIYITHDQREAMALATRVAVMARGRFLQIATPEEIYHRPAVAEAARFIGRSAVLPTRLRTAGGGSSADLGGVSVHVASAIPREGAAEVVVRPDDIVLGDGPLSGNVTHVFYRGGIWEGRAEVAGLPEPLPIVSARRIANGEAVRMAIRSGWALPG